MTKPDDSDEPERIDRVRLVRRGKRKIYHAEFHFEGRHCRQSLRTSNRKLAMVRAKALNAQLTLGTFRQPPRRLQIRESIEEYLLHTESMGRAVGTLNRYRPVLEAYRDWSEARAFPSLKDITATRFEQYLQARRADHEPATVHHEAVIIKQWLKWTVARGSLADHPLRHCRLSKPPRKHRVVPSWPQIHQMIECAPPTMKVPLAVLAMTGMRGGELRRLRVEDINLKSGWIEIVSRPGLETKTRASRRVPIHPVLKELLRTYAFPKSGYAFCAPTTRQYPNDGRWLNTGQLNRELKRLAGEVGLTTGRKTGGLTLHTLRRFLETHAVNNGIPQRCIDVWLGHTADRSMSSVYYSLTDEASLTFMRQLPFDRPTPSP